MYSIKIKTIYTILFDGEGKVKWEGDLFLTPQKINLLNSEIEFNFLFLLKFLIFTIDIFSEAFIMPVFDLRDTGPSPFTQTTEKTQ